MKRKLSLKHLALSLLLTRTSRSNFLITSRHTSDIPNSLLHINGGETILTNSNLDENQIQDDQANFKQYEPSDHNNNLLPTKNRDIVNNKPLPNGYFQKLFWSKLLPSRITEKMFKQFFSLFFADPDIIKSFAKVGSFVLWTFICISLLGSLGMDTKPLISVVSILSLTIGFAAKDILTNTFAGIFILFTRPFKRGWVISVCGYRGKVLSTDIRYLRLESLKDKSEILVPLNLVYQNAIIVEQKEPKSPF